MATEEENTVIPKMYYPVGNSRPVDVTLGCRVARQCDVLLLGCGDIRNVLYTTHVLHENGTLRASNQVMKYHLNDNEIGVITRDLILFHIVKTVNPNDENDMKFLWSVWYDVLLSKDHLDRLKGLMDSLLKHKSGKQNIFFGNQETEQSVKNCLASWTKDQHGTEDVTNKRCHFVKRKYNVEQNEIDFSTKRVASRLTNQYTVFEEERLKDRYIQEVQEYTDIGTTRISASYLSEKQILSTFCVNVTFFSPDSKDWTVPDDSSPFMCYNVERDLERYDGAKLSIAQICFESLREWVKSFQAAERKCKVQVHLWLDDARSLCERTLSEDLAFDFIDTSNLADSMGILPLLIFCRGKLREDTGVLRTETFDWHFCMSHGEHFLRLCIDIPPLMYPTVLGLHLAEELDVGHERPVELGFFEGCEKLAFRWKKAGSFTPCALTGSDGISLCLETIKSPKPLQAIDVFKNVRSALFDEITKGKVKERLLKVTTNESSLSTCQTTVGTRISEVISEFNDRYEIEIKKSVDPTTSLDLNWQHEDSNKRVITLQINTGYYADFAPLIPWDKMRRCIRSYNEINTFLPTTPQGKSKLTKLKKKGFIQVTIFKERELSVGECVLPWKPLGIEDIARLPDYPTSTCRMGMLKACLGWIYPTEEIIPASAVDKPLPRHQLQDVMYFFLVDATVREKTRVVFTPRVRPTGDSVLERYQTTIILVGHKLWEEKATTFVSVYDHDTVLKLIREGRMTTFDFYREIHAEDLQDSKELEIIQALTQGFDILARILQINSHRVRQDSVNSKWKMRSFIRARYPYLTEEMYSQSINAQRKYMEYGPAAWLKLMEEQDEETRRAMAHPDALKTFQTVVSTYKPVCDSCGKMADCKTCTGCDRVTYCSRACQRKAWPQHKLQCKKQDAE